MKMKMTDFLDLYDTVRVVYNGQLTTYPFNDDASDVVTRLVEEAQEAHKRLEIRYKRIRVIYYFDYDAPKPIPRSERSERSE